MAWAWNPTKIKGPTFPLQRVLNIHFIVNIPLSILFFIFYWLRGGCVMINYQQILKKKVFFNKTSCFVPHIIFSLKVPNSYYMHISQLKQHVNETNLNQLIYWCLYQPATCHLCKNSQKLVSLACNAASMIFAHCLQQSMSASESAILSFCSTVLQNVHNHCGLTPRRRVH